MEGSRAGGELPASAGCQVCDPWPSAFLSTRKELSELLSKTPDLAGETERFFFFGGGEVVWLWLECFDCWGGCLFFVDERVFVSGFCQLGSRRPFWGQLYTQNFFGETMAFFKQKRCNWEYDGSHQWWYCYCSYYCYYYYHYSYHFKRNLLVSISTFLIITIITIKSTKDDHLDYYWHYPLKLKKPLQRWLYLRSCFCLSSRSAKRPALIHHKQLIAAPGFGSRWNWVSGCHEESQSQSLRGIPKIQTT